MERKAIMLGLTAVNVLWAIPFGILRVYQENNVSGVIFFLIALTNGVAFSLTLYSMRTHDSH